MVVARAGEAPEGLERQDTRGGARVVRCEAQRLDHPRVPARARERVQRVHQLPRARASDPRAPGRASALPVGAAAGGGGGTAGTSSVKDARDARRSAARASSP